MQLRLWFGRSWRVCYATQTVVWKILTCLLCNSDCGLKDLDVFVMQLRLWFERSWRVCYATQTVVWKILTCLLCNSDCGLKDLDVFVMQLRLWFERSWCVCYATQTVVWNILTSLLCNSDCGLENLDVFVMQLRLWFGRSWRVCYATQDCGLEDLDMCLFFFLSIFNLFNSFALSWVKLGIKIVKISRMIIIIIINYIYVSQFHERSCSKSFMSQNINHKNSENIKNDYNNNNKLHLCISVPWEVVLK